MQDVDIQAKQTEMSRTVLICVVLGAAALVAFEGVRNNNFVFYDDDKYITGNENVQKGLNFESVKWAFTTAHQGNWHPLTWLSHLIDVSVFDMKPAGHHLVSRGFSHRQCNPAFFNIEENDGCDLAKCICRRGFRRASFGGGIGRMGC